jgi:hypothetical protein
MTGRSALVSGALCSALLWVAAQAGGEPVVIQNVDRYRVVEPLFEGARVVLSHMGAEYSPAYIQGISGAAFRIAGPCPCAPTCSTAMWVEDLLKLLGYQSQSFPPEGQGAAAQEREQEVLAQVRRQIAAGRPVLMWHAFTNYEWDVVCGFDEGRKELIGRGSYAGEDEYARAPETRPLRPASDIPLFGAIIVREKTGEFDARDAELSALEEAVRHARSPRDRLMGEAGSHPLPWRFAEGLSCYDRWIHSFRVDPQKVPDAGDRYCLGIYRSTRRAAGEFMRELAPRYPDARAQFERAATHFASEADALDECYAKLCGGWDGWHEPDPARGARAAALLTKARREYGAAIQQIERALERLDPERAARARQTAFRKRDGDRVWIEGVPPLAWGRGKDCTFAGAMESAMAMTRHPYTYAEIMGLSGLAFRVRWCNEDTKTKWCPSCAIGEMPDEQAATARLTGWRLSTEVQFGVEKPHLAPIRRRIVASIDAGKPVPAYGSSLNMAVIYGYEDAGNTLLLTDYQRDEKPLRLPIAQLGPMQTYLGRYTKPPSLRDALVDALRAAVQNWRRERHDGGIEGRDYWYGDAALSAWIKDIEAFDQLPQETRESLAGLDRWNYRSLHDARKAAVQFLKDWSTVPDDAAARHLRRAADLYQQETELLEPMLADKRAAASAEQWSAVAREREVQILRDAQRLEGAAIAEMERALRAVERERMSPE